MLSYYIIIYHYQIYKMKLSIRLQNKGIKNHPYWHIIVAPQHKNIFGRYIEHIGIWSPRHNVNIKRQVVFNIPKLMYWLGNGAVPTFKVQKFMAMFGLFPKPWHYIKSATQLAELKSKQKPQQQWTAKEKSLKQRKRKRQQRLALPQKQYHRLEAYALRTNPLKQKFLAKQHANQFQNSVLRDALHKNDFQKYERLAELAGDIDQAKPNIVRLKQTKQKLRKCRSQLAFLQKQHANSHNLQKSKLITQINDLISKLNQLENDKSQLNLPGDLQNQQQFISQQYLKKKLQYQLVTKRFQKSAQQLENIEKLLQPVTITELSQALKEKYKRSPKDFRRQIKNQKQFYRIAESIFQVRSKQFSAVTRFDLLTLQDRQFEDLVANERPRRNKPQNNELTKVKSILDACLSDDVRLPSTRPVHPLPDLKSYIPEQHYDPIDETKLDIMLMDSLEPHEQLQKYRRKRNPGQTIEQRKNNDHRKRMERLRLITEN